MNAVSSTITLTAPSLATVSRCAACPSAGRCLTAGECAGVKRVLAGEIIYRAGEHARGVWQVVEGSIVVSSLTVDGHEAVVRLPKRGTVVGLRAFLGGVPHGTTAKALTNSTVRFIPGWVVASAGRAPEGCGNPFQAAFAEAYAEQQERMTEILVRPARARFFHFCAWLADSAGVSTRSAYTITLPMSFVDLAGLLGIAPESCSRLMARIKRDGVMSATGRRLSFSAGWHDYLSTIDNRSGRR